MASSRPTERAPVPHAGAHRPDTSVVALLFLGFALFYSAFINAGYLDSTDAEERFGLLRALADRGSLLVRTRWDLVPHVVRYSPGSLLPSLPFYLAARAWVGGVAPDTGGGAAVPFVRFLLSSAIAWSALLPPAVYALVLRLGGSPKRAVAAALTLGLATLVFPYSKSFQTENLVGLILVSCALSVCGCGRASRMPRALATGLALGFALTIKLELAVLVPLYAGLIAWEAPPPNRAAAVRDSIRPLVGFALGLIPGVVVCLAYNVARGGSLHFTGYGGEGFGYPLLRGLAVQFVSVGKGLFWYCPVVVPALALCVCFTRRNPRLGFALLGPWLLMTIVYSKWHAPAGDASLGPRFQVSYLPLLVSGAFAGIPVVCRRVWGGALALAAAGGFLVQVLLASVSFIENLGEARRRLGPLGGKEFAEHIFFTPRFSMLSGVFRMFRERSLDLFLVRHSPTEGGWLIHPWFAILAAAGLACMILALRGASTGRPAGGFPSRRRGGVLIPCGLVALLVLSLAATGDRWIGRGPLRLEYADSAGVFFTTWTRRVSVSNLAHDKVLGMVMSGAPCRMTWTGSLVTAQAGPHIFDVKAPNPVRLLVDGRTVLDGHHPDGSTWSSQPVELAGGAHRFEFVHELRNMDGKLRLRITPPGGPSRSLAPFLAPGPAPGHP